MNDKYFDRINRIVEYLNQQVESTHSLQELADVARISPFHFNRVYRAVTGETPFGTLRRLRFARAANMLRDSEKPITEIAFDVGYESSQTFSRAFRQLAGCSATEARADQGKLQSLIEELSGNPARPADSKIEVRLVSVEPFKVIASRHVGPPEGLFAAFGELFDWAEKNELLGDYRGIYGIPIDDPRDESDAGPRFDCCFDFGPAVEPAGQFDQALLGGGLYAVTRHIGPYEGLNEKYDALYGAWLEASAHTLRNSPSYNHYLADPGTVPEHEWETDIYLPVE
jgi:AraC family transcriptional regulator